MVEFTKATGITREEIEERLWDRRANEYVLLDESKDEFNITDKVKFMHRHQTFDRDLHEVEFELGKMLNRSITCPVCQPKSQHEYGVQVLRDYFKNKLGLTETELEEKTIVADPITNDDGVVIHPEHPFDFLVWGNLVVHYFDSSYFMNFTKESEEMKLLMVEFADSKDFDLLPVTYTDITNIVAGGELKIDNGDDDEEDQ
jgi:hypothetical protein